MNKTNLIKIDYDYKKRSSFMKSFIKLFVNLYETKNIIIDDIKIRETNKGFHITIKINKSIENEISLLYALLLRSDINREIYNICRLMHKKIHTYNFFAIRKEVRKNDGTIYISNEKITKRSRKFKLAIIKKMIKIENGCYKYKSGKYF